MYRQFIEWQMLDISREPMEVAPTAHYTMGGIVVDPETHATDVPGLYAAGECVGGLHGANRLGGNSLGEALISGRRAGEAAAAFAREREIFMRSRQAIDEALEELDALTRPGAELARPLQRRLRDLMWERCGVVRDEAGLRDGLRELEALREAAADVDVRPGAEGWTDLAHALDLRAGLAVAEATLRGAIERRETPRRPQPGRLPRARPGAAGELLRRCAMEPWPEPVPGSRPSSPGGWSVRHPPRPSGSSSEPGRVIDAVDRFVHGRRNRGYRGVPRLLCDVVRVRGRLRGLLFVLVTHPGERPLSLAFRRPATDPSVPPYRRRTRAMDRT